MTCQFLGVLKVMANGFPEGSFRIVNKATGACIASGYGGETEGLQEAKTARGETGVLKYSHTNDRLFVVHDKVRNTAGELWYFDSHADSWGRRVNLLYNNVIDARSRWVLGASVQSEEVGDKYFSKDVEAFIKLLPVLDEQLLAYFRSDDGCALIGLLRGFIKFNNDVESDKSFNGSGVDNRLDVFIACYSIRTFAFKVKENNLLKIFSELVYPLIGAENKLYNLIQGEFFKYLSFSEMGLRSNLGGISEEQIPESWSGSGGQLRC